MKPIVRDNIVEFSDHTFKKTNFFLKSVLEVYWKYNNRVFSLKLWNYKELDL